MMYAEWDACLGCGLNLWKWENGEYNQKFMTKVMAFWKLHNLIGTHTQDAINKESEKQSKRKH